jgi:succinyl-diaminopimelate desuccinylase
VVNDRPPLETDPTEALVLNLQKSAQARGIKLTKRGLFFYTDASQLVPQLKIPFVILGPGDDREAHKPNESIALASITKFATLYAGFICDHYS